MRSSSWAFFKRLCPKADSNISGNILIISILITLRQLNGNWLNGYILYHFKQTHRRTRLPRYTFNLLRPDLNKLLLLSGCLRGDCEHAALIEGEQAPLEEPP